MLKAKVRGIYSTALTRLLLDNGFKIVQPSAAIKERFNLPSTPENNCQSDLDINDRFDKQGVNIVGNPVSVEKFASILFNTFDDVIIRRGISTSAFPITGENSDAAFAAVLSETLREVEALRSQRRTRTDVEFPFCSKKKLDEIRSFVVPTISGHHYYKACGGKIAYMLEMAEKLLERGGSLRDVEALFKETIQREYPHEGSRICIEHVKIDGRIFHLGEARIIAFNEQEQRVKLLRVISTSGIYDGLKVRKEPGDYAVTNMKIGEWGFKTSYFSKDGVYKGTYININTPLEIYPNRIRYVDLEVDICMWPDGKIQQIDLEKFNVKVREGYISERLRELVSKKIDEILNSLSLSLEKEALYVND
jgi:protein associated with RNAse G/E